MDYKEHALSKGSEAEAAAYVYMKRNDIEKKTFGGQILNTGVIANYPGALEEDTGASLANRMLEQCKKFGAELVKDEVLEEMLPYLKEKFGNPSSMYTIGREAKKAIENARERVAKLINCKANEIYFTGSGSESDNTALKG